MGHMKDKWIEQMERENGDNPMRLRDTFAAAALTGLLSRPQWMPDECVPEAYRLADAMLRERERTKEKDASFSHSNHDAATGEPGGGMGSGDTTSPPGSEQRTDKPCRSTESQSPASERGGGEPLDDTRPDTKGEATGGRGHFPDSRTRDIVTRLRRWCHAVDAESAQDLMDEAATEILRLRLTAEEREAVEWFASLSYGDGGRVPTYAATLRSLLKRLA